MLNRDTKLLEGQVQKLKFLNTIVYSIENLLLKAADLLFIN